MADAVDLERLRLFSDGTDDGMRGIVRIFLEDIGESMEALRAAVLRGVCADIALLAHKAAGSCGACGASALAGHLETLEDHGRSGNCSGSGDLMQAIESELSRVRLFMETYLASAREAE